MAEFITQPPFVADHPAALGSQVSMNEGMREVLLKSQQSIADRIESFPTGITGMRFPFIRRLLNITSWDLKEAWMAAVYWNVLVEAEIEGSRLLVTNNALLCFNAIAVTQSGILVSDRSPRIYIGSLPDNETRSYHLGNLVQETRTLLGTSLLAQGIRAPRQRTSRPHV